MGDSERVLGSPDCGFGTFAHFRQVADDVMWMKFKMLREGADRAGTSL
jgi:hypothetical protein